jgi:hypothetical protein
VKEVDNVRYKICWLKFLRYLFIQDQSQPLISLPNGTDLTLKPIEFYDMPVRLSATEEGALLNHLEVITEDGKTM